MNINPATVETIVDEEWINSIITKHNEIHASEVHSRENALGDLKKRRWKITMSGIPNNGTADELFNRFYTAGWVVIADVTLDINDSVVTELLFTKINR